MPITRPIALCGHAHTVYILFLCIACVCIRKKVDLRWFSFFFLSFFKKYAHVYENLTVIIIIEVTADGNVQDGISRNGELDSIVGTVTISDIPVQNVRWSFAPNSSDEPRATDSAIDGSSKVS